MPALAEAAIRHYENTLQSLQTQLTNLTAQLELQRAVDIGRAMGLKITKTVKKPRISRKPEALPLYSSYFKDMVACVILQEDPEVQEEVVSKLSTALSIDKKELRKWARQAGREAQC